MIRFFAGHPTAANLLMVAILVLGGMALPQLQRDTFPLIPATEVEISVKYPGATPADIELAICQPIEDALDVVSELVEVRCDARENRSIVTVEMREGSDIDQFFTDVKAAVDAIEAFPVKAEKPVVVKLERVSTIAEIAIIGDMMPADLRVYAEDVKQRMKLDRRIAQVTVKGFSDRQVRIEIPRETARRYNLSLSGLADAVRQQSIDLPAGTVQSGDGDFMVRFADERRQPSEYLDLVVKADGLGGQVRLGEIAKITVEFENDEDVVLVNGKRAALLQIAKTNEQDTLRVRAAVAEALEKERKIAPKSVEFIFTSDVSVYVRDRLRILAENGLQGLALVFLAMWLFFNLRFSFWVAMGLPVAFLGAIFFMYLAGLTINMMTMVALIMAIGLLMDDAIVISENVAAKYRQGTGHLDAAVRGTTQVMPGVLSSFVTTVIVLGPISFMAGRIGAVLQYIPVILIITLLVSLLEAFLILPAHLNHTLSHTAPGERSRFHQWFDRQFEKLRSELFSAVVTWAVRWRYLTFGLAVMMVLAAAAALPSGLLKFRAFPELESDVIQARVLLPQGTPLQRTQETVRQVVQALKEMDDKFSKQQEGGQRLVKSYSELYGVNVDAYEGGPHVATVSADLLSAEERVGRIDEMLNSWRTLTGDVVGAIVIKFTDRERGVAGRAIDIQLHGNDLDRLKQASLQLQNWLRGFKGVLDLSDDLRPGKPELQLRFANTASLSGLTAQKIAEEVRAALLGRTGLSVRGGFDEQDVIVRLAAQDRRTLTDIEDIVVTAPDGKIVPISALVRVEEIRGFARIHRINGQRTVAVQGTIDTGLANARELMMATKVKFLPQLREKYPDIRFSFAGEGEEANKTGESLQRNIIIGIVGIFLLLAFQFKSYIEPVVVVIAIPLGFVGAVVGHLALGYELSMPSLVGLATLSGVVVNDSILLVTFIKEGLAEGMTAIEAAVEAARARFRAVILTSVTTIAGLLPLLLETSTQAQFLIPLVISLAFGLLFATVLSLIVVPVFYTIIADFRPARAANTSHT